ncbi:MAG: NUDIX domain-containing protein [Cyclobacteriaceae bacterium]
METGVIIARFQTPYLHEGHIELIEKVKSKHNKLLIVLGIPPVVGTRRNPYDYHTREKLIKSKYKDIIVLPLSDQLRDDQWSEALDSLLTSVFPNENFKLYGSRDSFIPYYSGKHKTEKLPEHGDHNASELRQSLADKVYDSEEFRAGILYAYYNQYTKVYPTVDMAVFRDGKNEILLGKKPTNHKWRLIGGFADPEDESFEEAAVRELREECGPLEVENIQYEMSAKIPDWRYRNEEDKIITTVFSCDYLGGETKVQDDIIDLDWFRVDSLPEMITAGDITDEHLHLFRRLIDKYVDG